MANERQLLSDTSELGRDYGIPEGTRPESSSSRRRNYPQGKYWLLTMPHYTYVPHPHPEIEFLKGQVERGEGGYLHWQIVVGFKKKVRMSKVKTLFGDQAHCELTRSEAAEEYVLKEETRVDGTRFELVNKIVYL